MKQEVIVLTEILNGVISGHKVFLVPVDGEFEDTKHEVVERAEEVFKACAKENIPNLDDDDLENALDNGYIDDDNGYEITFRWEELQ